MQAWGPGNFDNEHATDWLDDLYESEDLDAIILAMRSVIELAGTEELDVVDCACALAAAEIVAAAAGKSAKDFPRRAMGFIDTMQIGVAENVKKLARDCVEAVQSRSPLLTHWKKEGMLGEWLTELEGLSERLA